VKVRLWQVNTAIETSVDVAIFGELNAPRVNLPAGVYGVSVESDDVLDLLKNLAAYEWRIDEESAMADCCVFCTAFRGRYKHTPHTKPHLDDCLWLRARVILGMDVPA
jgi:glutathione S-transferase